MIRKDSGGGGGARVCVHLYVSVYDRKRKYRDPTDLK